MLCVYALSGNQFFWCTMFVVWTHISLVILLHSTTAVVCCYISWKMPQSSLQHSVYTSPDRPGCNESTGFYYSWAETIKRIQKNCIYTVLSTTCISVCLVAAAMEDWLTIKNDNIDVPVRQHHFSHCIHKDLYKIVSGVSDTC